MRKATRAFGIVVAVGLLAACGFRPLYLSEAVGGTVSDEMAAVEILPIADRRGQMLRNALAARLNRAGPPAAPRYVLATDLSESLRELASRLDDSATRANLVLTAEFNLRDKDSGRTLLSGRIQSSNNYSISRSDIATLAAERDARQRGARDIAERMTLQIGAFLSTQDAGPTAAR